jgi:predicted restriction endonuclease
MLPEYYQNKLRSLNVDRSSGHPKPHKVCLLLSILDLIESGELLENKIVITDNLKNTFHENFKRLKKGNDAEKLDLPFYHLRGDGIWHFSLTNQQAFDELAAKPGTPSLNRLFEVIDYAYLDPELFDFFKSSLTRPLIRQALLENLEDLSEQFHRWLMEIGKSEKTAKSYVGAIRGKVSEWASDAGIYDQNLISVTGHSAVRRVMEELGTYEVFREADQRGKAMYSSALKSYLNFLDITYQAEVSEDIEEILKDISIEETQRMTYVNARIGQGKFRTELIEYWDRCAVTGYSGKGFLVASHIKPWKVSNSQERLDKFNGLLLLANIDKAFDLGFVTFNTDGGIVVSEFIEKPDVLGIHKKMKIDLVEQHQAYMEYHRAHVYESKTH